MRILMTNGSLRGIGGSEKWTHSMAEALAGRGHEIDVLTHELGTTSDRMKAFADVRLAPSVPYDDEYDLLLSNHSRVLAVPDDAARARVYTSHGPQHRLEAPAPGADVYVGVSPEVVEARRPTCPGRWEVITNGVDLTEFYPPDSPPSKPRALIACKSAAASNMAAVACEKAGIACDIVHYLKRPVWEIAERMRACTFLIGIGRTAAEALACGLDVLLFNEPNLAAGPRTDGWITSATVDDLRTVNFSARRYAHSLNLEQLQTIVAETRNVACLGEKGWQRAWAEREADVERKADQYLALMDRAMTHDPDLTAEYEEISR